MNKITENIIAQVTNAEGVVDYATLKEVWKDLTVVLITRKQLLRLKKQFAPQAPTKQRLVARLTSLLLRLEHLFHTPKQMALLWKAKLAKPNKALKRHILCLTKSLRVQRKQTAMLPSIS